MPFGARYGGGRFVSNNISKWYLRGTKSKYIATGTITPGGPPSSINITDRISSSIGFSLPTWCLCGTGRDRLGVCHQGIDLVGNVLYEFTTLDGEDPMLRGCTETDASCI